MESTQESNKSWGALGNPLALFYFSLFVAVLAHGSELFNFSLTADEDTAGLLKASDALTSVRRGRWGSYLMNLLVQPSSVVPYFPTALSMLLLAASATMVSVAERLSRPASLIFCAMLVSSPINGTWLQFSNAAPYYAAGIFAASSAYALCRPAVTAILPPAASFLRIPVAALLLGVSMSTYQPQFLVFAALVMFALFTTSMSPTCPRGIFATIKSTRDLWLTLAAGPLVYAVGDWFFRAALLPGGERGMDSRLLSFIKWDDSPDAMLSLWNALSEGILIFAGSSEGMKSWGLTLSLVPLAVLLVISSRRPSPVQKAISLAAAMGIVIAPSLILVVTGNPAMPVRSMLAMPIATAAIWGLAALFSPAKLGKFLSLLCVFSVMNSSYINARISKTASLSAEMDRTMATRIAERILAVTPSPNALEVKVAFVGRRPHPRNEDFYDFQRPISKSWFEYPRFLTKHRSFFVVAGFPEIRPVQMSALGDNLAKVEAMPSWPARGSVKAFGDIVVVKLR